MNGNHFAGRLKELRERAGLTQKQLAEKAGMALGGVNKLEQGVNKPGWETVIAVAQALGVDCRAFLEEPAEASEPKRGRPKKGQPTEPEKPKRPRGRPKKGE